MKKCLPGLDEIIQIIFYKRKDFNNDAKFSPCPKTFDSEPAVFEQQAFILEQDSV
jgi:hypothetical protein